MRRDTLNHRHDTAIELRQGVAERIPSIDCVVFDVDGVLVDVSASYPAAIIDALKTYTIQTFPEKTALVQSLGVNDVARFKTAGGFNDEWDLAYAAALWTTWQVFDATAPSLHRYTDALRRTGGGLAAALHVLAQHGAESWMTRHCDRDLVVRLAQEYYAGPDACRALFGYPAQFVTDPGRHKLERPLVPAATLEQFKGHLGLYTGRSDQETDFVLSMFDFADFFPATVRITASSGINKPDPKGLFALLDNLPHTTALFIGDTRDDARTVQNYRDSRPHSEILFAGITGGAMGDDSRDVFISLGADILAGTTQRLLGLLLAARLWG